MSECRGYIVKHPLVLSVALPESDVRALYEWQNGVAREIAADRAKVVAWLRREADQCLIRHDQAGARALFDAATALEHEETCGGE